MIFLCGRGDCDPDHCLFSVKKGMSVYKMMSFPLTLEVSMFCNQCEQTAKGTGCTVMGVCGKLARCRSSGPCDLCPAAAVPHGAQGPRQGRDRAGYGRLTVRALFSTLTNVNFDPAALEEVAREAIRRRKALATKLGCTPDTCDAAVDATGKASGRCRPGPTVSATT